MSRSSHLVLEHAIDQITTGHSYRHDLGDLDELTDSIKRVGLLTPISITTDNVLISGKRRLAALRRLGFRTVPVWVVTGVSDKLSMVLAIQDENTLHKMLTTIEQAELYAELTDLIAEENARKQEATRFGASRTAGAAPNHGPSASTPAGGDDGGVDSTPPQPATGQGAGKTRVQAAKAVTGYDSHSKLDQVVELQHIAASDDEHPEVRQAAAEALIELNADGKVNGRYLRVKIQQATTALAQTADDPNHPEPVRAAARAELDLIRAQPTPKDALREALRAVPHVVQLRQQAQATAGPVGWTDADPLLREKHRIRRLVDLLRREHGWWERFSPSDFGQYATDEQWELVESFVTGATEFLETARADRS
ncbi:ParB N-terminal domain-containing protein [Microbacterium sp. 22303]|uniref:ParB N-terminal domain-containing protein n=1 Tax=Microbacterium sp. 22303 TaxID=3453905 RepID=UPI003F8562A0